MLKHFPRSAVAGIGFPAPASPAISQMLAMQYELEMSQWLSAAELELRQMEQLGRVLAHAYETVPYYRALFDEHGVHFPEKVDANFVRTLPISRRTMILQDAQALRSRAMPAQHGTLSDIRTSGSTGVPVELLNTDITRFFWRMFLMRDHAWHERDFLGKLGVIRWAARDVGRAPAGLQLARWPIVEDYFDTGPCTMLNVATPVAEQVEWLLREQPRYLLSFPSNLAALARHCLAHRITLPSVVELRTIGETVVGAHRTLFRQAWGVRAVDVYSCEEAGYLALQCPQHEHYHIQSENVFLEVVNDEGKPCGPGESGRVLITTLHNFATPLIRYELGDYAEPGTPCTCGRGLPVLARINGRRRNRLALPDGRSEFPYLGEHGQIDAVTGVTVRQVQVIQHSVEEIELRLVADREFTQGEADRVAQLLQGNLGHPFRIRITYWNEIPKGPTGKFDEFVSLI